MVEKSFEAKTENLSQVLEFLEGELEKYDCDMKIITSLSIVIEELFVNVALYAYPGGSGQATLKLDLIGKDLLMILVDKGIEFNPLSKKDPDITLKAEDREIGGLGIFMVKKTMDEMSYERKDNMNILSMKKRIKN